MTSLLEDTPREIRVQSAPYAVGVLRRLIQVGRGKRRPLVHLQHNPDPDAAASALGVQYLFRRLFGVEAILTHTGQVGRAENRAMLRWLRIQMVPAYKVEYAEHDLVCVVDTHPGAGTCRLPPGIVPDIVVDHHPVPDPSTLAGVSLAFLDSSFGATSTMIGYLLTENAIPIEARVATALVYGIKTDTQDLARTAGPFDEQVYRELHARADKRLLARIERARLPQEYFVLLEKGLRRAQVSDFAVTTSLGAVPHNDAVAEIADLLFRLEGMKWALAAGHNGPLLYVSIRAVQAEGVDAGAVAREISDGNGGGHETFAAAQIPMPPDVKTPDEFFERVRERFLQAIRAKKTLTRPLTLPPDAA